MSMGMTSHGIHFVSSRHSPRNLSVCEQEHPIIATSSALAIFGEISSTGWRVSLDTGLIFEQELPFPMLVRQWLYRMQVVNRER